MFLIMFVFAVFFIHYKYAYEKESFMNSYGLRMIFKFKIENEARVIYEECIRLFHGDSFDEAFEKAEEMAAKEKMHYINPYLQYVTYEFWGFAYAYLICDDIAFIDGAETFSVYFELEDPHDDPIKCRFKTCFEDKKSLDIIANAEFNGLFI